VTRDLAAEVERLGERGDAYMMKADDLEQTLAMTQAEVERLRAFLWAVLDFADPNEPSTQHALDYLKGGGE
jgi:hypothetical protein